jgi:hypothetical protein
MSLEMSVEQTGEVTIEDIETMDLQDGKPTRKRRKNAPKTDKTKKENYVDEKEFTAEIKAFYESGKPTDTLGTMIFKIANGLSHRPNFINYSFRDEMVADAIVNMFRAINGKKFDLNKGYNPFSYFTCIAFHTFCTRIKKEKKHREAIEAYQEEYYPELMEEGRKSKKQKDDE